MPKSIKNPVVAPKRPPGVDQTPPIRDALLRGNRAARTDPQPCVSGPPSHVSPSSRSSGLDHRLPNAPINESRTLESPFVWSLDQGSSAHPTASFYVKAGVPQDWDPRRTGLKAAGIDVLL